MTRGQKMISTRVERLRRQAIEVACQRASLMEYYALAVRLGFSTDQAHEMWQQALQAQAKA